MVIELEPVFEITSRLPAREQQVLAAIFSEGLEDEGRWSRRFDETPEILKMLVNRAKAQYAEGICEQF